MEFSVPILLDHPFAAIGVGTKWFVWLTLWYSTGGRYWLYLFRNTIRRDARLVGFTAFPIHKRIHLDILFPR